MMRLVSAIIVACVAASVAAAAAETQPPSRTISVSGTVETKVAPDHVVWTIGLSDGDRRLLDAKRKNDLKVEAVLALRKKLSIADGDLETGGLNIQRDYERTPQGNQGPFKGFIISRTVTIRQRDLKRFDEFLDALVSSAEMEVGFSLESSKVADVRVETRLKALEIAKNKAAAMAKVVDAKLGRVLEVSEDTSRGGWGSWSPYSNYAANAFAGPATPAPDVGSDRFVPGNITLSVTVHATFELQ